jgi:hypothetical protein
MSMFERLQKPFLTVETGEAYQPIRLTYHISDKQKLMNHLNTLQCIEAKAQQDSWNWFWKSECDDLHFESLDSYEKKANQALRLGTLTIRKDKLHIHLPSFKRACLAVPFFHYTLPTDITQIEQADFINKVFGMDERLPHGFSEIFKDEELEKVLHERIYAYEKTQSLCEQAANADEALKILSDYARNESNKKLPYIERYSFSTAHTLDPDIVFLSFYIFLRSRELVAIRRWFGESGFSVTDAVDETVDAVFGNMNVDIIE